MKLPTNRRAKSVLVAGVIIATSAGWASGVSAGSQYTCANGLSCSWKDSAFDGSRLDANIDVNSLGGIGYGDNISSAYNRGSATMKLWQNADCAGTQNTTLTPGVARSSLTYNDTASSLDMYGQPACGN